MKIATFLGVLTVAAAISGPAFAQAESAKIDDCVVTGAPGSIALKTVEPDTLIVGTVLPNPGWFNGNSPTSIKDGFEYCMAAEIAHRAGLKSVRLMNLAWDQHISGTVKGYDVAIASTTITPQRQMVFDFSQPYFGSNLGVAIKAGSDVTAENLRQKRIGVLQGNMGAEWVVKTLQPEVKPALFQAQPDMLTALMAGHPRPIFRLSSALIPIAFLSGNFSNLPQRR
jgi:polar amino acid transport system substrate-binding protein